MELPQYIELWYLIPALRKSIAFELKQRKFTQRKIAVLLDVTEPAVSQYLSSKSRGQLVLPEELLDMVKKEVENLETNEDTMKAIYRLTQESKKCGILCQIHRQVNEDVPKDCDMCGGCQI